MSRRFTIPRDQPIETAIGPELLKLVGLDHATQLVQRHRDHGADRAQFPLVTFTRALTNEGFVEVITCTRETPEGKPLTVCALSTEWHDLTGERPPRRPVEAREN